MDTKTVIASKISSGIISLDELLQGLRFGDNVIFLTSKPRYIMRWKTASDIRLYCAMGFETQDVERKTISILRVLNDCETPLGSRVIARRLKDCGIELGERAVRYHLKLMDEGGLTHLVGQRDGRILTKQGVEEIECALVKDKVGFAISRIELLSLRTNFDLDKLTGSVPINVSFFPKAVFDKALEAMKPAFAAGLCASNLVAIAQAGEVLGEVVIPQDKVGLATVCSVVINGVLLKLGVPVNSKFSGILQFRNSKPVRFVELINYSGCSLDPSDVFIRAKMTSVSKVASDGDGKILATYRDIPAPCQSIMEKTINKLRKSNIGVVLTVGGIGEPLYEISAEPNRISIVLLNGLNPVAAAVEAGVEVETRGMSTVIEYKDLTNFEEVMALIPVSIIPCLDIKEGRVVKGVKFVNLIDARDPVEAATTYCKQGADELVFLDIFATVENRKTRLEWVKGVRDVTTIPFAVGGGIASIEDMKALIDLGVDKVSINTAAVRRPQLITEAATEFGMERLVVAIDGRKNPPESGLPRLEVVVKSGDESTGIDIVDWAKRVEQLGAGQILLTSKDADGTKDGYDLEMTRAVAEAVAIPVTASGGAGTLEHLYQAVATGKASAVLAASIFHFGEISIAEAKAYLKKKGIAVNN